LSEAFHLLGRRGGPSLAALLRRRTVVSAFHLGEDADEVLKLMQKYSDAPMSFGCLSRANDRNSRRSRPSHHRYRLPSLPSAWSAGRSLRASDVIDCESPAIKPANHSDRAEQLLLKSPPELA
jgi:hypothetical protein